MSRVDVVNETPIVRTPRVMQCEGYFDVPVAARQSKRWSVELPLPDAWTVGVIVGPSGSGKTTLASALFGKPASFAYPSDRSVLDAFPEKMAFKEIALLLSSVGFSSPPDWLRPYATLSNGEKFRVDVARALAETRAVCVLDEFTSVVDRTVAQIGSAAVAKAARRAKTRFVAVSCHYDILDWLEPDWVYEPHTNRFTDYTRGDRLQRPEIELTVVRVSRSLWSLFRPYHYLSAEIHVAARCFAAFYRGEPVAFNAVLFQPTRDRQCAYRSHRLVCRPDFQGVGIGNALSITVARMMRVIGARYFAVTSHPALTRARAASPLWRLTRKPSLAGAWQSIPCHGSFGRMTSSFEFIGQPMDKETAWRLWQGQ